MEINMNKLEFAFSQYQEGKKEELNKYLKEMDAEEFALDIQDLKENSEENYKLEYLNN